MRVLQKYTANRECMDTLRKRTESMNAIVKSVLPKDRPCPPTLREQLRIFSEYVCIFTRTQAIQTHIDMYTDIANMYLEKFKVLQLQ